jgi:hypothetical protein
MFKIGDLIRTADGDRPEDEAIALVLKVHGENDIEVCYCSGPCDGDISRESSEYFDLVSRTSS